jgi:hypothetical protein
MVVSRRASKRINEAGLKVYCGVSSAVEEVIELGPNVMLPDEVLEDLVMIRAQIEEDSTRDGKELMALEFLFAD